MVEKHPLFSRYLTGLKCDRIKLHADVEAAYCSINFPLAPLITSVRVAAPSLPRALLV
jgi:hypothetical protein